MPQPKNSPVVRAALLSCVLLLALPMLAAAGSMRAVVTTFEALGPERMNTAGIDVDYLVLDVSERLVAESKRIYGGTPGWQCLAPQSANPGGVCRWIRGPSWRMKTKWW